MTHSCENTSLQNDSVENLQFPIRWLVKQSETPNNLWEKLLVVTTAIIIMYAFYGRG